MEAAYGTLCKRIDLDYGDSEASQVARHSLSK